MLGQSSIEKQAAYCALFKGRLPDVTLAEIRNATNKAWVLGSDGFKEHFSQMTGRVGQPKSCGGDRKPVQYKSLACKG